MGFSRVFAFVNVAVFIDNDGVEVIIQERTRVRIYPQIAMLLKERVCEESRRLHAWIGSRDLDLIWSDDELLSNDFIIVSIPFGDRRSGLSGRVSSNNEISVGKMSDDLLAKVINVAFHYAKLFQHVNEFEIVLTRETRDRLDVKIEG